MEKTYCTKCGKEQVEEPTGKFDKTTGKPVFRKVCPVEPCAHGLHDWSWKWDHDYPELYQKYLGNRNLLYRIIFDPAVICRRCGCYGNFD